MSSIPENCPESRKITIANIHYIYYSSFNIKNMNKLIISYYLFNFECFIARLYRSYFYFPMAMLGFFFSNARAIFNSGSIYVLHVSLRERINVNLNDFFPPWSKLIIFSGRSQMYSIFLIISPLQFPFS